MIDHTHQQPTPPWIPPLSETAEVMKKACARFLDSLTPELRKRAHFNFESPERRRWHYVPREMFDRKGVSLKEMNYRQHKAAFELLASGLSHTGYEKVTAIMDLEKTLAEIERSLRVSRLVRDPQLYYLSTFGDPTIKKPWGWRAEGHHISLNFTMAGSEWIAPNPLFLGANPAEVQSGSQKGLRILAKEEDLARRLLAALNAGQKRYAIISPAAPPDILTRAVSKVEFAGAEGLAAESMAPEQREFLARLIHVYIDRLPHELSAIELKKLKEAGLEAVHFAWAGPEERGKPHYYRLHGPFFFVEYDNTQNNANHIHTVWRNLKDDFGEDLLNAHYQKEHQ
ncbi:MAG: DUF3500 domain-containing protein [Desulfobacterales bacterium]|nr:MAG: DUF3500 domain-containing protein [Desulfobacterales bacterium]